MATYVAKGGTLAVFPAEDADLANYKAFLQSANANWPLQLVVEPERVDAINLQNEVFKAIFENLPQHPDLPVVSKYYQLSSSQRGENLMALPGNRPFWSVFNSGRGKVYLSAVPLLDTYSNLQRHALFVPIMLRIALLSGHDQPLFYTLGQDENIAVPPIRSDDKQVLKLAKGNVGIIPDARHDQGNTRLFIGDQLQDAGIYDLKKQDSLISDIAFNNSRLESDLSYMDPAQLNLVFPQSAAVLKPGTASIKGDVADLNFGLQLWKLCIILALFFIAAEILLFRYYHTGKQVFSQSTRS